MKLMTFALSFCLFIFLNVQSADLETKKHRMDCSHHLFENVHIDMEDGDIIISSVEDPDATIEITRDNKLYINHHRIDLDDEQEALLSEYYQLFREIQYQAKKIGYEGARIGIHGAELGLEALAGVFEVLLTDLDEGEFEKEMEEKAEKLELKAEILEEKAEKLEAVAEELELMHGQLRDKIPELRKVQWFYE